VNNSSSTSKPASRTPSVRLRVAYKSPQSLLGEFTRSVGQGCVALETERDVAVGTRFIFELHASGLDAPVEVLGEVVSVATQPSGRRLLTVRYDAGGDRAGLDAVLQRIFDGQEHEPARRFPRIPLHLRATEDAPFSPAFLVKDISRGGLGLEVEAPALPRSVRVGTPFLLEMTLSLGLLRTARWCGPPAPRPSAAWRWHPPSACSSAPCAWTSRSGWSSCSRSAPCPPRPGGRG
jgi:hypothetical protein